MSFIADRVVMDGLTFDDVLLIPATFRATASKFSKVVICIRSFLQILYHSITTKVVAINIQALGRCVKILTFFFMPKAPTFTSWGFVIT